MDAKDFFQLLGYILIFVAVAYGAYMVLPGPRGAEEPLPPKPPRPSRRTPVEWARLADQAECHQPGHAKRVADLALALAEAVGLDESEHGPLKLAALLHDVGMLEIEPDLAARQGPLSRNELYRLWEHSALGAKQALDITGNLAVSQWVRWHHERWDGLGYPDGLAGSAIPLPARILRLADSAESMLQARPYRAALSPEEVIAELTRLSGVSYDPQLVRVFVHQVLPGYLAEDNPEQAWGTGPKIGTPDQQATT